MRQGNLITLIAAVIGAVKLVLNAFGVDVVTDDQVNAIANGIAALLTVIGVLLNHGQAEEKPGL